MTERLSQLLAGEADGLDVPPPTPGAVIREGRGMRRRHRMVVGACGVAAALVVGGSVAALAGGGNDTAAPDPAGSPGSAAPVFSYGNQVFYDGPAQSAPVEDKAVKSLFYSSAGVVVRAGDNSWSDGGGEQRFSLITPDGDVRRLSLVTEETVHASDPDQPYVVYGEEVGGNLEVVVYDVQADAEAARVTVAPTEDHWFPVSIDGDTVYVQNGYDNGVYAVDWRSGKVQESDLSSVWEVAGGHAGVTVAGKAAVVDTATGDVLLTADGPGYFDLSPDGRYAQLVSEDQQGSPTSKVYAVASGSSITVDGDPFSWGWTADGDLFTVEDSDVRTCDVATGDCSTAPFDAPGTPGSDKEAPELRLGGRAYES
ncbi:YncE family protein [Nocardioides sp. MH1]|uniref:YncE family protein n=1 Tax=Nocardioides sp. MH1 TaxID=3242490 RepID=UPI00351F8653